MGFPEKHFSNKFRQSVPEFPPGIYDIQIDRNAGQISSFKIQLPIPKIRSRGGNPRK